MSATTTTATKPKVTRKLKVTNVIEAAPVTNTVALVDQLLETTTAPIQTFTAPAPAPVAEVAAVPEKKVRKPRAARNIVVTDAVTDAAATDAATDAAVVEATDAAEVVSKRKYTRKPKAAAPAPEVVAAPAPAPEVVAAPKRKPRATKTKVSEVVPAPAPAPAPALSLQMPELDPFSPSATAIEQTTATHEDVDVEECSINGKLYYRDARGQLYDHTTFARVSIN